VIAPYAISIVDKGLRSLGGKLFGYRIFTRQIQYYCIPFKTENFFPPRSRLRKTERQPQSQLESMASDFVLLSPFFFSRQELPSHNRQQMA
jgi:hypothetical protein